MNRAEIREALIRDGELRIPYGELSTAIIRGRIHGAAGTIDPRPTVRTWIDERNREVVATTLYDRKLGRALRDEQPKPVLSHQTGGTSPLFCRKQGCNGILEMWHGVRYQVRRRSEQLIKTGGVARWTTQCTGGHVWYDGEYEDDAATALKQASMYPFKDAGSRTDIRSVLAP